MPRTTLLASAFALLIAGPASFAIAQDAPPPGAAPMTAARPDGKGAWQRGGQHDFHGHGDEGFGRFGGPDTGVLGDLRALEHLYVQAGRSKELPALYNEVLAKSQDPRVRDYAYRRLARAQAQPANLDQAIDTLRKSLDENLANEARRRAEFEQLRAQWQQRHPQAPAPAGH